MAMVSQKFFCVYSQLSLVSSVNKWKKKTSTHRRRFGHEHLVRGIFRLDTHAVLGRSTGCCGRGLLLLVHYRGCGAVRVVLSWGRVWWQSVFVSNRLTTTRLTDCDCGAALLVAGTLLNSPGTGGYGRVSVDGGFDVCIVLGGIVLGNRTLTERVDGGERKRVLVDENGFPPPTNDHPPSPSHPPGPATAATGPRMRAFWKGVRSPKINFISLGGKLI